MTNIRVLLVDDHDVFRKGLRLLLETESDMLVVGEAEDGRRAVEEAKRLRPDVVLMDASMPQLNGLAATRQITSTLPSVKVLILSGFNDEDFVGQAIEASAAGFVMKEAAASEVCDAIREVHNGRAFFSPVVSRCLIGLWRERELRRATKSPCRLTGRQMEVLQLIAEGYASKQIAGLLSLASKTVERHRQTLMGKVDCRNIASLTRYAVAKGIVEVNNTAHQTPNWPEKASSFGKWLSVDTARAV